MEYYNLNSDEVINALDGISNLIKFKSIENELGNTEFIKENYNYVPAIRDYDSESYNCVEFSEIGELTLGMIFDEYEILDVLTDYENIELSNYEIEELFYYYNIPRYNMFTIEGLECEGCVPKILSLKSKAIRKAMSIACNELMKGNRAIVNEILNLGQKAVTSHGDFIPESATLDLESKEINILYSSWSLYEIECATYELLEIERYCRKVVEEYGKN